MIYTTEVRDENKFKLNWFGKRIDKLYIFSI